MSTRSPDAVEERPTLMPTCLPPHERGAAMVSVVGESFHQQALEAICGRRNGERIFHSCEATLVVELHNEHDANAIRVDVAGRPVGHLSRADAAAYRSLLVELREAGYEAMCPAFIAGRAADDPHATTTNLGVFLNMADPARCRAALRL